MTERPHDVGDLYLAPVALKVEARIAEMSAYEDLAERVELESDQPSWSVEMRKDALLRAVAHLVELHGWSLSWDDRGIRLSHGTHSLVLGVPSIFTAYINGGAV